MMRLDDSTLVAFVDGELDADAMRGVADAIEHDPEAREKVIRLRHAASLTRAVFDDPAYLQISPTVAEAVTAAKPRLAMRFRRWRFAFPIAASVAAVMLSAGAFILGEIRGQQMSSASDSILDEIAEYHVVYAKEVEHQVEVPAERIEHIQTWLGERLHRKLTVPDLSSHGLVFKGARLLVVDGNPVAQLVYDWPEQPQRPFAVCITLGEPGEGALQTDSRDGLNLALWRRNGYAYVLVGWVDMPFLTELAVELAPKLNQT